MENPARSGDVGSLTERRKKRRNRLGRGGGLDDNDAEEQPATVKSSAVGLPSMAAWMGKSVVLRPP